MSDKSDKALLGAGLGAGLGAVLALVIWLALRENKNTQRYHQEIEELSRKLMAGGAGTDSYALGVKLKAADVDVRDVTWEEVVVPLVVGAGTGFGLGGLIGAGIVGAGAGVATALGVGLAVALFVGLVVTGLLLWAFDAYDKHKLEQLLIDAGGVNTPAPAGDIPGPSAGLVEQTGLGLRSEAPTDTVEKTDRTRREGSFVAYSPRLAESTLI